MEETKALTITKNVPKSDKSDNLVIQTEQERTIKGKKDFLKAFTDTMGIITASCKATGLSRETFYEWCRNDNDFAIEVNRIRTIQRDHVEDRLLKLIAQDDRSCIMFYLKVKHPGYMPKQMVFNADVRTLEDLIDEDEENLNKENEPIKAENTTQPTMVSGASAKNPGQEGKDSAVQEQSGAGVLLEKQNSQKHLAKTKAGGIK